jgi:alkylation response protein AidB-like acyl-CoA dehydrogenase
VSKEAGPPVDFRETDEQTMLRAEVRRIARRHGHAYFVDCARAGRAADELWRDLAEAGFLGVNLPEEHGGGGLGIQELAMVCEELAAAGCPLLTLIVSPAICGSILARFGTEAQRTRWLPPLAAGDLKLAFAITEADAGSNSHRIATVAQRDGAGWRLRGSKQFISCVDDAAAVLVVASTGDASENGRRGLSLFLVDSDAPGLQRAQIPVELTATERQFTLFFDDVLVPADRMVGCQGDGLRQVFAGLNPERITGAAVCNGIALYALERAAEYARERRVWDVPIGAHQGLSHPLAKAKIEVELARLMTQRAAWTYDQGEDAGEAANMAKYAAAEAGLAALDQAIQTHGGNGLTSEYGLADLWGVARLLRIAPVSREMILNHVAHHALALPRSH